MPALFVCFIASQIAVAQSQPSAAAPQTSATPPDRTELLKVKPNISGQRNGVFIEPDPMDFADHAGYVSLFDGKTLTGWDGQPGVWSVEDGAIVGVSTKEHVAGNSFLVYHGAEAKDFDLKLEIKVEWGGGSGVQYRSSTGIPPGRVAGKGEPPLDARWVMIGPQADFWYPVNERAKQYSGQLYSQNTSLGIVAWRGQVVRVGAGQVPASGGNHRRPRAIGHVCERRRVEPVHDHREGRSDLAHSQRPVDGGAGG